MISEKDIIARKGREVLLIKKKSILKYYRGQYDSSMMRIRNIYPINKPEAQTTLRLWS